MKRTLKILLIALLGFLCFSSCVSKYRKVKISSCEIESFLPSGLKGFNAVAKVGIDNPAPDFNIKNIRATIRRDSLDLLYINAENIAVDGKCNKVYKVPVSGQISKSFSLIQVVALASKFNPDEYRVDISGRATVAGNLGKDIEYKNVPLKKFIEKL